MERQICVETDCTNKAQRTTRDRCRKCFEALKVDGILPPLPRLSLWEAFDKHVSRTDECWIWQGSMNGDGYGSIVWSGKRHKAHRLAWELYKSEPVPAVVDHMCRERRCVNPGHLQAATQRTNGENLPRASRANRTTGVRGVHYNAKRDHYVAYVTSDRKRYHAGCYSTLEEAEAAAITKRLELHTNNLLDRAS